mgnify:CR=1 FL=1|jgi:hypothetical protein|nr:MAG TPA: hypothetical protein [Caudoviricetes sp.]
MSDMSTANSGTVDRIRLSNEVIIKKASVIKDNSNTPQKPMTISPDVIEDNKRKVRFSHE